MIYESTRKMSVKEQEVYDLGYLNGKHAVMCSPWVKTSGRVPTGDGLGESDVVLCHQTSKLYTGPTLVTVRAAVEQPKKFPYWMPIPPLPEVTE